jgi:anti-anti-sigma regulatory factor
MSLGAVDFLACLQLEMRRRGLQLRLRDVSPALRELIALAGLEDVLGVEPRRQAEEREERAGVEEERDLGDPAG